MLNDPLARLSTKQYATNCPTRAEGVTEDEKLPKSMERVLDDGVATAESGGTLAGNFGAVSSSKMAKRYQEKSTMEKDIREQEKVADDIDYILRDDTPAAETKEKISFGKVLASLTPRRVNKSSTRDKYITEEEKLEDDIEYILNDNIPAVKTKEKVYSSSATASPSQKARRAKKHSAPEKTITEEKNGPADDIESILNDIVIAAASIGRMSSSRSPIIKKARQPKTFSAKKKEFQDNEELVSSVGFFFNDDSPPAQSQGPMSTGAVSSTKKSPRAKKYATRENKLTHNKNIARDADYVLKDDITSIKSNLQISSGKVSPKRKGSCQKHQAGDNVAKNEIDTLHENIASNPTALVPAKEDFSRQCCKKADEQLAKDIEYILNDDPFAAEPHETISSGPCSKARRPKTSNPKLMLAMDMDKIFDSASITPANQEGDIKTIQVVSNEQASRPKKQTRKRKSKHTTIAEVAKDADSKSSTTSTSKVLLPQSDFLSTKDSSMWAASSGKIQSTACATSRTNDDDICLQKSNDILILEEVESSEQISSSSYTVRRSPKISPREDKHVKVTITGKKINDKLQADIKDEASIGSNSPIASLSTRLRKKHPMRKPKKRDNTNLDEIINEILEIPAADSVASEKDLSDVAGSLQKTTSLTRPNKLKSTEKISLDEAIEEILEIPTLGGDSKQPAKLSSRSKERKTNSGKKVTCAPRDMDIKKPTAHQATSVPDIGFPDAKASAINCDSGFFVASGDNMRPLAAGGSRLKPMGCFASSNTVKLPSSNITRQQLSKKEQRLPAIMTKEENTLRKAHMRASSKSAVPSLGGLQGMATHRKAAVHVIGERTSPGIFYECQELELMKQIERESRCC